jgi:hypothetical protein
MHKIIVELGSRAISKVSCTCGFSYISSFGHDIDRVTRKHARTCLEVEVRTFIDGVEQFPERRAHPFRRTNNGIEL